MISFSLLMCACVFTHTLSTLIIYTACESTHARHSNQTQKEKGTTQDQKETTTNLAQLLQLANCGGRVVAGRGVVGANGSVVRLGEAQRLDLGEHLVLVLGLELVDVASQDEQRDLHQKLKKKLSRNC